MYNENVFETADMFQKHWNRVFKDKAILCRSDKIERGRYFGMIHDYITVAAYVICDQCEKEFGFSPTFWNINGDGGGKELKEWIMEQKKN